jgi:CHAT domain-containing protein/tetratricopeptide (TPR) repeat protein
MRLRSASYRLRQSVFAIVMLGLSCGAAPATENQIFAQAASQAKKSKSYSDEVDAAKRQAELVEKRSGSNSPKTASAWQKYGDLLATRNQHSKAVPIMRRVLAIRVKVLGENHADTAYTLNQLGSVLEATEGDAAAEPYLRRALQIRERVLGREHLQTILSVHRLERNLFSQSRYSEAEPYLQRAAASHLRTLGNAHALTAKTLLHLGDLLEKLSRYQEAVSVYEQALTAHESAFGTESSDTALALHNLGWAHMQLNQIPPAVSMFERAAAIREKILGAHPHTALTLQNLSTSYVRAGRFDDGELASDRALSILETVLRPEHVDIAVGLTQRARFHVVRSQYLQAEKLAERALSILEKQIGADDVRLADAFEILTYVSELQARYSKALDMALEGLKRRESKFGSGDPHALRFLEAVARNQAYLGRYAEAERSFRDVIQVREKIYGTDGIEATAPLTGLADAYDRQGRHHEAEMLNRRVLEILQRDFGPDHFLVTVSLGRLGLSLQKQRRYAEAEVELRRCVAILERTLGEDPKTAGALVDLANVYEVQGRTIDAEAIYQRSISIMERHLGTKHPDVAPALGGLSSILWKMGRAEESESARARQLSINLDAHGPDHDNTALSYAGLAWVQLARGRWDEALSNYARATDILIRRSLNQLPSPTNAASKVGESEIGRNLWAFLNHVRTAYWAPIALPGKVESSGRASAEKTFELVQWAYLSDTSAALSQMSLRVAPGDDALAARVREHQDLLAEWRVADAQRAESLSKQIGVEATPAAAAAKGRLEDIERRLGESSSQLRSAFPQYAELSKPQAVSAAEVQRLLNKNEALLHFSLTPLDCFVWVITPDDVQWVRLEIEHQKLVQMATAMRQQLSSGRFNLNLAYDTYRSIFGPIEEKLAGKDLLIVPTGVLASLPLHSLVTEKPEATDEDLSERYRKVSWMAKRHAITVLPSVSALKALRQRAHRSDAPRPYLGIGNPLLDGPNGDDRRAWELKQCSDVRQRPAVIASAGTSTSGGLSTFFRGGTGDVSEVRRLEALPETVAELCAVAGSFGHAEDAIVIGSDASEATVKRLSREGTLAAARVVHFATHGLVAGEIQGLAEPALVLTPPSTDGGGEISPDNDGLLTASEIVQLKLNADWVVLSACNTASGDSLGAEALSGLARAFFYAGARALLVSHWMVNSEASVKLMVATFAAMARDPSIGRAEALRRAMIDIIDNGEAHETHPRYWAPFFVVGEGAAF